ncbi:NAD(P)H-hydrate epimerase [uncultured Ezakiella sp.]|uniref:NAD(P)H-hydrate epimerase n=1 Tax=uncultured Ezakiella sp. TaxID=1637529 RepID=UPI0025FCB27F|nr:NAD(P)H-hydrate epimerase [uncultured Ezakiella sp.]
MKNISKSEFIRLVKFNNSLGISNDIIIENQASSFIKNIELDLRHSFAIITGTGLNGAIGLAITRHLIALSKDVSLFIIKTNDNLSKEFTNQLEIIKNLGIKINELETLEELSSFPEYIKNYNTIIDAILGVEYDNEHIDGVEYVIDSINKSRRFIMSVDIPSGLDYEEKNQRIVPVYPDIVITYHAMKETLNMKSGIYSTKVIVENIGLLERENVRY